MHRLDELTLRETAARPAPPTAAAALGDWRLSLGKPEQEGRHLEYRAALHERAAGFNEPCFDLPKLEPDKRLQVYAAFAESAAQVTAFLADLDTELAELEAQEHDLANSERGNLAGRFLHDMHVGATLWWALRYGENFLAPRAHVDGWADELKFLEPALAQLHRSFDALFTISPKLNGKLAPERHAQLHLATQQHFEQIEQAVPPADRVKDLDLVFDTLDRSVHEKSELLAEHTKRVGYKTYLIIRESYGAMGAQHPDELLRLLMASTSYASWVDFMSLRERLRGIHEEFTAAQAAVRHRFTAEWTNEDTARAVANLTTQREQAEQRLDHWEAFLRAAPLEPHRRPRAGAYRPDRATDAPAHDPVQYTDRPLAEIFPAAEPKKSRLALWIAEKQRRRRDGLAELHQEELLLGEKPAGERAKAAREIELARERGERELPQLDTLAEIVSRPDFTLDQLGRRFLLDVASPYVRHQEAVARIDAQLAALQGSDPAAREAAIARLQEEAIRKASLDLLGWTDGSSDCFASKVWEVIRDEVAIAMAKKLKAATLHDVGKVGSPEAVLKGAKKLKRHQRNDMSTHPLQGGYIGGAVLDAMTRQMIKDHHAPYDSPLIPYQTTTHPGALRERAIPHDSRAVSLADAEEAIREIRPYNEERLDYDEEMAWEILDTQLDAAARGPASSAIITDVYAPPPETIDYFYQGRTQFDPILTAIARRRGAQVPELDNASLRARVAEICAPLQSSVPLSQVLDTTQRVQEVRSPHKANHSILSSQVAHEVMPNIPHNHPWKQRLESEADWLGLTAGEYQSALETALAESEIGFSAINELLDSYTLTQEHELYVEKQLQHIEASVRLFRSFGDTPWIRAVCLAILFHHAKRGGGGFYPSLKLVRELTDKRGKEPEWAQMLRDMGVFTPDMTEDELPPIPEISAAHQIISALVHRSTDEGLPPAVGSARLKIINERSIHDGKHGRYDPRQVDAIIEAFHSSPRAQELYSLGAPEFATRTFHAYPLLKHMALAGSFLRPERLAQLASPELALDSDLDRRGEYLSWLSALAEKGGIVPRVRDRVQAILRFCAAEQRLDPEHEEALHKAGFLHDIGKAWEIGVERNYQANLEALRTGAPLHTARGHERDSVAILRHVFFSNALIDETLLTGESPKVYLGDDGVTPVRGQPQLTPQQVSHLTRALQEVRALGQRPEQARFVTELTACHQMPLDLLIWIQDESGKIIEQFWHGPNPSGELPRIWLAHTVVELVCEGITELPQGRFESSLDPQLIQALNQLLRATALHIAQHAELLATIESSFHVQGSVRERLQGLALASQQPGYQELGVAPFLNAHLALCLADMSAKQPHVEGREDANDYVMLTLEMYEQARRLELDPPAGTAYIPREIPVLRSSAA